MMKEYSSSIPKGKVREKLALKGQILSLRFTRTTSSQEVRNQIICAFKVAKFVVLDCDSTGHNLIRSADQSVDGEKVVALKGGLYLCEKFDLVCIVPLAWVWTGCTHTTMCNISNMLKVRECVW